MNIVIFLLSFILVLSSLFLILLVLVQLPKKEAGLGQAFGSSATDALFGPGSGNMLTKMTKWTAAIFFVLTIFIWILQGHNARAKGIDPRAKYPAPAKVADATPVGTNQSTNLMINAPMTNAPMTNAPTANAKTTNAEIPELKPTNLPVAPK